MILSSRFLLFYLVAFFSAACFSCSGCRENNPSSSIEPNPLLDSEAVQKALSIQDSVRALYKRVRSSVVRIETEKNVSLPLNPFFKRFFDIPESQQKKQGLGSGFIINESGLIATNYHVVAKVDRITVKLLDGSAYDSSTVGYDKDSDIALLKIDTRKSLPSIEIGDSSQVFAGDLVYAIGNPFGFSATLTSGVVSSANQKVGSENNIPRIQTDAAINPGNSGGPLLDIMGRVIGINQMIYSDKGGSIGIGFAIPINHAMKIIEGLKKETDQKNDHND